MLHINVLLIYVIVSELQFDGKYVALKSLLYSGSVEPHRFLSAWETLP